MSGRMYTRRALDFTELSNAIDLGQLDCFMRFHCPNVSSGLDRDVPCSAKAAGAIMTRRKNSKGRRNQHLICSLQHVNLFYDLILSKNWIR